MGIFAKWKERRAQRRKLKELSQFASVFMSLEKMQSSGLISWDKTSRRLFIDSSLAYVMIAKGADAWTAFIQNVYLWQYSRLCNEAWADYMDKEGLKAVREYMAKLKANSQLSAVNSQLSRADIDRIREARRMEIAQSDMESPKIEGFEFFIVAPPDLNGQSSMVNGQWSMVNGQSSMVNGQWSNPIGQLVSVGHYDPATEQMEMALWSDIEHHFKQNN